MTLSHVAYTSGTIYGDFYTVILSFPSTTAIFILDICIKKCKIFIF